MKVRVTSKVDSHHTNPKYKCLVIEWNGDANFRCRADGSHDWMPSDEEGLEFVLELVKVSPTFWPKLMEAVNPATHVHDFM